MALEPRGKKGEIEVGGEPKETVGKERAPMGDWGQTGDSNRTPLTPPGGGVREGVGEDLEEAEPDPCRPRGSGGGRDRQEGLRKRRDDGGQPQKGGYLICLSIRSSKLRFRSTAGGGGSGIDEMVGNGSRCGHG